MNLDSMLNHNGNLRAFSTDQAERSLHAESSATRSQPEVDKDVSVEGVSASGRRKRGAAWEGWEDRALVKQVLADDPILNKTGKKEDRWKEVAEHLKRAKMDRSWISCKDRTDKLVTWHRKGEAESKQKTGAVEEVSEFLQDITEVVLLFDSVSQNTQVRQDAKDKLAAKKVKGKNIREASMKGQVRKRDLLQMEKGEENEVLPVPRKAPKNQFAKEVHEVVEDLHQQADEFKKEVVKKRERDRKASERQEVLNENLQKLIDSQMATNEMMKNWMNISVQGAIRPRSMSNN